MSLLDSIQKENDIKKVPKERLPELAGEIRRFLIDSISKTGGHLASNLGAIELTMALHRCMSFPEDKLIFDVGHQSYTHKILTGRKDGFKSLRQLGGMSGFPKSSESDSDAFNTGHSSTSLSAPLVLQKQESCVAVMKRFVPSLEMVLLLVVWLMKPWTRCPC